MWLIREPSVAVAFPHSSMGLSMLQVNPPTSRPWTFWWTMRCSSSTRSKVSGHHTGPQVGLACCARPGCLPSCIAPRLVDALIASSPKPDSHLGIYGDESSPQNTDQLVTVTRMFGCSGVPGQGQLPLGRVDGGRGLPSHTPPRTGGLAWSGAPGAHVQSEAHKRPSQQGCTWGHRDDACMGA
jgi:hypothetical protein